MKAAVPENESERLAALDRYDILDTPREREFDEIVELAAHICRAPTAVVNLITAERQWFKAEVGLGTRETPLESSFCAHAILEHDLLVVPDTTTDDRFACNPLVTGEPFFRFYAGAQLKTSDGYPLGTLCILDTEPRELDDSQLAALRTLSHHVMNLLDLRRTMREQKRLSEQLAESNSAYRKLHSMVSHDLRTPLGALVFAAHQLEMTASDESTEKIAAHIMQATDAMTHLVEDLTDATQIEANELSLKREAHPVGAVIDDTASLLETLASRAGVGLRVDIDDQLPPLLGDARRISQVLLNIVGNAIKFSSAGDNVVLRVREANTQGTTGELCFEITDTGPGIAESELGSVFEARWRSPSTTEEGSGMGLAISRRIIELHGGRVGVESEVGVGTTFWFTLPAAERANSESSSSQRLGGERSRGRI